MIRNSTLTLIGAGVQIIPDRLPAVIESFNWVNKARLFELFKKNKVGQVMLLSGDVHYAQMFDNKCRSLSGQRKLVEVTSSGLSHTQQDFAIPFSVDNMNLVTSKFFSISDAFMDLNFGEIRISK